MNGNWPVYGLKPSEFKLGFQRMANIIRTYTNLTAMVWGPNIGTTYPFGTYTRATANSTKPTISLTNWALLDTNGDGNLDVLDDPYTPYYPGDEYVDWVALSLYWSPDYNLNTQIWPEYWEDSMTGTNNYGNDIIDRLDARVLGNPAHNFYARFAEGHNKPFLIPETGAPWFTAPNGRVDPLFPATTELSVKQYWWQSQYNATIFAKYPKLKGVVYFEEMKTSSVDPPAISDWRILNNPVIRAAFNADLVKLPTLLWAQQLSYQCGGQVSLKK